MDVQTILLLILLLLAINLVLVGFYIVLVLRDVRKTIKAINALVDEGKNSVEKFKGGFEILPLLAKAGVEIYKTVKNERKK